MEATWVSIDRGMDKDVVYLYLYMHSGILLSHKNDLGQTEKNITWYHLYVETKNMTQSNLLKKQTHGCWKQTYGYQGGKVGGGSKLRVWN